MRIVRFCAYKPIAFFSFAFFAVLVAVAVVLLM